jgi:hypothetical protein
VPSHPSNQRHGEQREHNPHHTCVEKLTNADLKTAAAAKS